MDKDKAPKRIIDRTLKRIQVEESGCWIWTGGKANGYGRISWKEGDSMVWRAVHRVIYREYVGVIPEGMDLDHLCHDPNTCTDAKLCPHRACCNPEHLEPVTRQVNLNRGGGISAKNAAKTHCNKGHSFEPDNFYLTKKNQRVCKICWSDTNRRAYLRRRDRRSVVRESGKPSA